jgi:SAM-dependent methyltransferase
MNSIQPNQAGPAQFSSRRKRELLDQFEAHAGEQYRGGKFNAAYREGDQKFMRFLIPPGKRVLELGCGNGGLLAALEPSYGVGVDFSATTIAKANALYPHLHFVLGDAEDPATLAGIEGPFDYICDRRHHRHVRGHRWYIDTRASIVRAIYANHHRLLLAFVGADFKTWRDIETQEPAIPNQLHRHRRFLESDGSRGF